MKVLVRILTPLVYEPRSIWFNDSGYHSVYEGGWEIYMLRVIGKALNLSLDVVNFWDVLHDKNGNKAEKLKGFPFLLVGLFSWGNSRFDNFSEYTHSYLTVHAAWYTPCALKCQKWSRFFNIFSVDMWICFVLSLVLAVVTVSCISHYGHKSHLHESNSYSNVFSVTANIIAVSLSVPANIQPRSTPLRLSFFCWVCYSVAISTVFQAYLTKLLVKSGYEEPIKTVEEMLRSERKFGFFVGTNIFYRYFHPADSAIFKHAIRCLNESKYFI
jgi:hypothetical protein